MLLHLDRDGRQVEPHAAAFLVSAPGGSEASITVLSYAFADATEADARRAWDAFVATAEARIEAGLPPLRPSRTGSLSAASTAPSAHRSGREPKRDPSIVTLEIKKGAEWPDHRLVVERKGGEVTVTAETDPPSPYVQAAELLADRLGAALSQSGAVRMSAAELAELLEQARRQPAISELTTSRSKNLDGSETIRIQRTSGE